MKYPAYLLLITGALLCGCATQTTEVKTPAFDQQLQKANNDYSGGSIWQAHSMGLVDDYKARHKGDIVTIVIVETSNASKEAKTDTSRNSTVNAGIPNFLGLEQAGIIKNNFADLSKLINASAASTYAGSGSTSRTETLNATISAKVIDVLSNGNLQIEGRRDIKVNNEDQLIIISGTVRPSDIGANNTVNSTYIADARISYTGKGIISDRQSPGWLMNVVDKLWPF